MHDTGFPFSAQSDAKVLILGSMPGKKSLAEQQYYAHPHNAFWPIMTDLFSFSLQLPYEKRLSQLHHHQLALWDVAQQCIRPGSMDHAIEMDTVMANDFAHFFAMHTEITHLFFNGHKAEQLYHKLVIGTLPSACQQFAMHRLPSSSPAHASMCRTDKLQAWKIIRQTLELS